MSATIEEAPSGASDLFSALLAGEPEPLTVSEAHAIVADFLERVGGRVPSRTERACRCGRPWEFEPDHCSRCGRLIVRKARTP